MSSAQGLALHVGQALNGASFSLSSPLIVPCSMGGVSGNLPAARPITGVPAQFDNFITAVRGDGSYGVQTRWGEGQVSTRTVDGKFCTDFVTDPIQGTDGDSLELSMRSGVNGDKRRYVGARFSYRSGLPFFGVMQLDHIRGTRDADRMVMTRAGGVGAMVVLSGIDCLRDVAFSRASLNDTSWADVLGSLDGGISPMTAFLMTQILSEEKYPDGYADRWELHIDGANLGLFNTIQGGRLVLKDSFRQALGSGRGGRVDFRTKAKDFAIDPGDYVRDVLPRATVSYLPAGARSDVFHRGEDDVLAEPAIEIVHHVGTKPRGQTPYVEVVADLVLEAAGLRPETFPLVK